MCLTLIVIGRLKASSSSFCSMHHTMLLSVLCGTAADVTYSYLCFVIVIIIIVSL